ncbi:hypothetical protein APICC_07557 [Apis cerana cerana]|uniref:Uncharacterized protein n=1 Tax=Apis cerana cerana TaxID=94128 RepID=A0A2A3E6H5_APICC|nr:hypothetical protein APICC_07557 [Apis cerana cerana]
MLDLDFRGAQQLLDNFFEPKTTLAIEFLTHFKRYNDTFINSRQGILKESELVKTNSSCGGGGGGGAAVSGATPEAKKGSIGHKCQQQQQQSQHLLQHHQQQQQQEKDKQQQQQYQQQQQKQQQNKGSALRGGELAPLSNLDEDLDDLEDEKGIEQRGEEEEYAKEGGTQHRLSPRLHDIEEEDDEDGRNTKESRSKGKSFRHLLLP